MSDTLLLVVSLPFLAALGLLLFRRRLGRLAGWLALPVPAAIFVLVLLASAGGSLSVPRVFRMAWVPSFGLDLSWRVDGLAVFYALVVTGVGFLVVLYALGYFGGKTRHSGRFFGFLCLFMGAMLGTVLSNNLLVLFVFWELTGVASFLLIGFDHDKAESRRGARMAFLVTSLTGLSLLLGILVLGDVFGSYELDRITEMIRAGGIPAGREAALTLSFALVAIGIFGKSAQFPFFFWLPNAMAAPTPVSAYLHSATMVKLGVFLTARLLPCFHGLDAWMPVLTLFGFGTMLLGAVLAVLSHDLKSVLANSTVSQLGLLIGYYGLFSAQAPALGAVVWDYVHILNHVFYKACLFMVVGIIDHTAGTRDLRELGGLFRKMPLTGITALIGLATMAGIPFTTGFLSKEMLLKTSLDFMRTHEGILPWWPIVAVFLGSVLKVVFSVGIFHRAFLGRIQPAVERDWHAPSLLMQIPPLLLAAAALFFGMPGASVLFGQISEAFTVAGKHVTNWNDLVVWHGFTAELYLSGGIVVTGALLYAGFGWIGWRRAAVPRWLRLDRAFDAAVDGLPRLGRGLVERLGANSTRTQLYVVLAAALAFIGAAALPAWPILRDSLRAGEALPSATAGWIRTAVVAFAVAACALMVLRRRLSIQLLAACALGIAITVLFALYRAPDLALTQILIESATLLLVVLFFFRLRRSGIPDESLRPRPRSRAWRGAIAGVGGLLFGAAVLVFQARPDTPRAGDYYLAESLPGAKGANAVNTILIDFRGFDTQLEIVVLLAAALGGLGLLMRRRSGTAVSASPRPREDLFPVPENFILRTVAGIAFFVINLFAAYLLLRGHHRPGGGFIAGLLMSLSFVLVGFTLGLERMRALVRVNGVTLASAGCLLALATAALPVLTGRPFLTHLHAYSPPLPLVGRVYLGTPLFFDIGVFLAVIGVVLKIVFPLMKSVHGLPAFVAEEEARYASPRDEPIDLRSGETPGSGGDSEVRP